MCSALTALLVVALGALYATLPLLLLPFTSVAPARAGQVVVVTGSSSGIGADMAQQLGRAGYTVVLAARRQSELEAVAASVLAAGAPGALPIAADLGRAEDCERVVNATLARYGRLDYLVINHALFDDGLFVEKDVAAIDATMLAQFKVNVLGPAYLIRAALPALEAAPGGGHIVEVSSGSIKIPVPFHVRRLRRRRRRRRRCRRRAPLLLRRSRALSRSAPPHPTPPLLAAQPGYVTTKSALGAFIKAVAAELQLLRSPVIFTTAILGMIGTPEVLVHEGLRPLAYPVADTAREIIIAAQRGEREVYVPHWTSYGVTLSFFSQRLESFFMSAMYTLKIPAYVARLNELQRSPAAATPAEL